MNNYFQLVFTWKNEYKEEAKDSGLEEIQVDIQKVRKQMENRDVTQATKPDDVLNWIMEECTKQLESF